uniref:Uncharacterized protein n=1 Tax=Arundo donax TaxID=35708 RepID=A0A0A8YA73_ARUDO
MYANKVKASAPVATHSLSKTETAMTPVATHSLAKKETAVRMKCALQEWLPV